MQNMMRNLGLYLGLLFLFRLGSGASVPPPAPYLVKLQTLHQEPTTTTAFEPRSAMTGFTTLSANIPIPAPEPFPTGALRGT